MIRKLILTFCYCALALGAFAQGASDSDAYFRYIQRHGQPPIEYIFDKIRTHSAVILGEDHWIDAHPLFLCDLVAAAERDSTTHIDALAVEFGNERDQALADSLMASPVYREDLVFEILRHTPDDLGNPYKEYADVFYATLKANQSRPADRRTRILLVDPGYIQEVLDGEEYTYTGSRDDNMFSKIRSCVVRRQKVVFYVGLGHALNRVYGVKSGDYYYNIPSAGFLLKHCYPEEVCILTLYGAHMGSMGYIPNAETRWERIAGGLLDRAFQRNGNRPVAFDLRDDFPPLRAETYFTDPRKAPDWSDHPADGRPYRKSHLLKDQCDGIVFVKPVEEFNGARLIDIYDEAFLQTVSKRTKGKCRTAADALRQVKEWHPILQDPVNNE